MPSHSDQDLLSQVTYEQDLLPYHCFRTHVQEGFPDILFHWHPELEVNYVHAGTARYHVDSEFFNSTAGDIILIRPNALHSIHPIGHEEHLTDTLQFHLDMVTTAQVDRVGLHYLTPLQHNQYQFIPRLQADYEGYQPIKACLMAIFEVTRTKGRHYELLLKAKLHELLYLLFYYRLVKVKLTDDSYRKNAKLRDVIDHINQHYQEPISIDQLAQIMGYSKTHFMTLFKQQTGSSAHDYVIQVRLQKAADLLTNTISPIVDIANEVGFNNLSNFNRLFKDYYQMPPSHYRKHYYQNPHQNGKNKPNQTSNT